MRFGSRRVNVARIMSRNSDVDPADLPETRFGERGIATLPAWKAGRQWIRPQTLGGASLWSESERASSLQPALPGHYRGRTSRTREGKAVVPDL